MHVGGVVFGVRGTVCVRAFESLSLSHTHSLCNIVEHTIKYEYSPPTHNLINGGAFIRVTRLGYYHRINHYILRNRAPAVDSEKY